MGPVILKISISLSLGNLKRTPSCGLTRLTLGAHGFVLPGWPIANTVTGVGDSVGQAGFKLLFCKKNQSS